MQSSNNNRVTVLAIRYLDGGKPNTDALGIAYVVIAIVYTLFLAGQLYLLYRFRSVFCVKVRNFNMIFGTVMMLHIYLVLVLLVYPWNGLYPCSAEFWVMSVFLPSGMAFFQACNAKVLTVYENQHRLAENFLDAARKKRVSWTLKGLWRAWQNTDAAEKVGIGTLVGLLVSFIPTIVLYFGSRRFHAFYGFFGTPASDEECRKGGEWTPSLLIQLLWTFFVGPWILWKIRNIEDVHSWAWQTRLAILAGLPGTPLWIAFTYASSKGVTRINRYFAPAGWFIPSLIVCQQVLILIPLRDAFKSRSHERSMDALQTQSFGSQRSEEFNHSSIITFSQEMRLKTSMREFDSCFEHNLEPLVDWATARDFTGENIIFLREVLKFKRNWSCPASTTTDGRLQLFHEASLIFFTLIHPPTAISPINIEFKVLKALQSVFSGVKFDSYSHQYTNLDSATLQIMNKNNVCPWDDSWTQQTKTVLKETPLSASSKVLLIPSTFAENVFDEAFESIKYLVFTNTWPRYIDATFPKEIV